MNTTQIFIDIGSTFTKAAAVDLKAKALIACAKSPTTFSRDITIGIGRVLKQIQGKIGPIDAGQILACSSAAGGLRMVSVGLVPELSAEAAKRAALGAGAKIVGHFSHKLTKSEIRQIEDAAPDLILLAGGTDGGNEQVIAHNATRLREADLSAPIIIAGNKTAYDDIEQIFQGSDKKVTFVNNVMPELGRLKVRACREAIRETFMGNIVHAKGLDRAKELVGDIIMPTPVAVLKAAALLGSGAGDENGFGEAIVVDVGGATTDVYSIAKGAPTRPGVALKGLPEPFSKRTVEGDLGVRHNIDSLAALAEAKGIHVDPGIISAFQAAPGTPPAGRREIEADAVLARLAVEASFERHVGTIETVYGPHGPMHLQKGKDLSQVRCVIGTGGPIIHAVHPEKILSGLLATGEDENRLKPRQADFYLDRQYILYAIGLLARSEPEVALQLGRTCLQPI